MQDKKPILTIIGVVLITIIVILVLRAILGGNDSTSENETTNSDNNQSPQTGSVSGTFEYNGIKPQTGEAGSVYIEYREYNTGDSFQRLPNYVFPLQDGYQWEVKDVPVGVLVDARAVIELNSGEILARSTNTLTVSAPSTSNTFEFNVTMDMIPGYVLEANPVSLGGTITINGYIPSGSTMSMYAKTLSEADFTEVVRNTPVNGTNTVWEWKQAIPGTVYQLKTEAYDSNGALFASSNVGEKAAPSSNANFVITSRAVDPSTQPKTVNVSGTVKVNGNYSDESEIRVKARVVGTDEYTSIAVVNPSNSAVAWSWTEAISGTQYDIKPFLVESGKSDIEGNKVTTNAPASGLALEISSIQKPDEPDNEPTLMSCESASQDGKYNAKLEFDNVDDADRYWLQVGKSEGASDVNNSFVNNSGSNNAILVTTINGDQNYYARYAYTECDDCTGTDSYSDFSDTLKFTCPDD